MTTTVAALPVGTYTDPSTVGLQFRVTARGTGKLTRSWLLRFRFASKDCRILLGHPPLTSLADARRAALELREKLAQGIDPRRATARQPRGKADLQVEATKLPKHTVGALAADFVARRIRPRLKHPEQPRQGADQPDVRLQPRPRHLEAQPGGTRLSARRTGEAA